MIAAPLRVQGANCVDARKVVTTATVNGRAVSVSFTRIQWAGEDFGILSVRRINQEFPTILRGGFSLCLDLSKGARGCSTPAGYCYGPTCVYQITSNDFGCCPVGETLY